MYVPLIVLSFILWKKENIFKYCRNKKSKNTRKEKKIPKQELFLNFP